MGFLKQSYLMLFAYLSSERKSALCLRVLLRITVCLYCLFFLLILVLRYAVLPNVAQYKPQIEANVSELIGKTLRLENIHASWNGLNPYFQLGKVELIDAQKRVALTLPEVNATLSWWSLLNLEARFSRIEVKGAYLNARRDVNGQMSIAGFPIAHNAAELNNEPAAIDWLLSQGQIDIVNAQFHWLDDKKALPELLFNQLNFVLENKWNKHRFSFSATPPSNLAKPIKIVGDFKQPVLAKNRMDLSIWTGELFADLHDADLPLINRYINQPINIERGKGHVRLWLNIVKGRLDNFTADLKLSDVFGRLRPDLPLLDMAAVSGRVTLEERHIKGRSYFASLFAKAGFTLNLIDFSMEARDGKKIPASTLQQTYIPADQGRPEQVKLYVKFLNLNALAQFAEHLPLPKDQRQLLIDYQPRGQLSDFSAQWQGTYPHIEKYAIKGKFHDLSMQPQLAQLGREKSNQYPAIAAVPAIPGFERLSGVVDANDQGGSFLLDSQNLTLQLPSYFLDPVMPFERLKMQARWSFEKNQRLQFQVKSMEFEQDGARASFNGSHVMTMGRSFADDLGEIRLTGTIDGFQLNTIKRFIPEQAPEDLRHWLSSALLNGTANEVSVLIRGNLNEFPFNKKNSKPSEKGEFLIHGKIADGTLDFAPGEMAEDKVNRLWPTIDQINGSFVFDRAGMEIRAESAKTLSTHLSKVSAKINDLSADGTMLMIDGLAQGPLQGKFSYLKASPVSAWLDHFLTDAHAAGNAQLHLKLQLPLNHIIDAKVQGNLMLQNNQVHLFKDLPNLTMVNGKLDFDEVGVNLGNLNATFLGGPVLATGGSQKDGSIKIQLEGTVTGDGLRQHFTAPETQQLFLAAQGASRYGATVHVKQKQTEVFVESSLQGMAINLPAPLNKQAHQVVPTQFHMLPLPLLQTQANFERDELRLRVGSLLEARYLRSLKNDHWVVDAAAVAVNAPMPDLKPGVSLNLISPQFNLDAWASILSAPSQAAETNLPAASSEFPRAIKLEKVTNTLAQYVDVTSFSAQTQELTAMGKKMHQVLFGASNQGTLWQANFDSRQASGYLTWEESPNEFGKLTARLSRLQIPKSSTAAVGDLLAGKNSTKQIPSIDLIVENFDLFDMKLGALELQARNLNNQTNKSMNDAGRDWRIQKLNLKSDDAELNANGTWDFGVGKTQLNFALDIKSAGKLLDRLDFNGVMANGSGEITGDLEWKGLPFSMDLPSLSGEMQVNLNKGQFLKVDTAGAKLIGVINLQSLPRRLSLDFRDVFSQGFSFDTVKGTVRALNGILSTDNLKMNSVSAAAVMEGSANLIKETQDIHVVIIPHANAGTASVVVGLAVNPVIGLSTFLAQLFFKAPLAKAFTEEYQISGDWKNPIVTNLGKAGAKNEAKTVLNKESSDAKENKAKKESKE
jgi:uncharacterized protein (TIGR02099 family)